MLRISSHFMNKIFRWLISLVLIAYACSNVHFVPTDQVGMIQRFGALVHAGTPQAVQGPGLLLAFPKPIDNVVLLSTQRYESLEIQELSVRMSKEKEALAFLQKSKERKKARKSGFHPERFGYVVTGDQNIVHMSFVVQYRLLDPLVVFEIRDVASIVHRVVLQSIVEQVGGTSIDALITDGLYECIKKAQNVAQEKMDGIASGVEISTIEVVQKEVPKQVRNDFERVQSEVINAQTSIQEAYQYKEEKIPAARSLKNQVIQKSRANALKITSQAKADIQGFMSVSEEYNRNSEVVWERLYREGIEKIIKRSGAVHFIPPPIGEQYPVDFHIEIGKEP
jgi:modulator of FtsH protease HflK